MSSRIDIDDIYVRLEQFETALYGTTRVLAIYSAAIAVCDERLLEVVVESGLRIGLDRKKFYEVVLQSHLFLGFPRMLIAADHLGEKLPVENLQSQLTPISPIESQTWFDRGVALCRQVYGDNYDRLKDRVESFAPDIFRWMVLEGYGKTLSRPGLGPIDRELAIVACLMVENRQQQLFSHIRGAFNVGADRSLVELVIGDMAPLAPLGHPASLKILSRLDDL
ncbi:MAG: carboxymuconolactone decarboxylase family protein [candidate division Zixibacteria bacterium]|nr:carboxymuconolactone decarboxylase family protein [candidate division Zixibacteria bacterium]